MTRHQHTEDIDTLIRSRTRRHDEQFVMEDEVEAVEKLKYLAVELNSNGTLVAEIPNRVIATNKAYFPLSISSSLEPQFNIYPVATLAGIIYKGRGKQAASGPLSRSIL